MNIEILYCLQTSYLHSKKGFPYPFIENEKEIIVLEQKLENSIFSALVFQKQNRKFLNAIIAHLIRKETSISFCKCRVEITKQGRLYAKSRSNAGHPFGQTGNNHFIWEKKTHGYNEGPIKGPLYIPRYQSAVMSGRFQGVLNWAFMMTGDRRD